MTVRYEIKIEATHPNAPKSNAWLKYIVNGNARVWGEGSKKSEDAVRIAGENAAANGVEAAFQTQDLAVCDLQAAIVVANVLAPVLIQFAESIARCVRRVPGNALILSGILESQYDEVRDAYVALGFRERKNILAGEWKTGMFEITDNR